MSPLSVTAVSALSGTFFYLSFQGHFLRLFIYYSVVVVCQEY